MRSVDTRLSEVPETFWKQLRTDLPRLVEELAPVVPNQIAHIKASAQPSCLSEILAFLRRDGAVIVENAVAPQVCDAVMQELAPYLKVLEDTQSGLRTKRLGGIFARSKAAWDLGAHPLVMDVAAGVLSNQLLHEKGPPTSQMGGTQPFHAHGTQFIQIHPGETAQALHKDRTVIFDLFGGEHFEPQIGIAWALEDIGLSQGPTRVVLGSHKWPADHPPPTEDMVSHAAMPKGSALFYASSTYHGGGANTTGKTPRGGNGEGRPRNVLFFSYNLAALTQEENQYVACPADIAKDMPLKIQHLLGYTTFAGVWGFDPDFPEALSAQESFRPLFGPPAAR